MSELIANTRRNIERRTPLRGSKILLTGLCLGIGYGLIVESHTNEVATGKAITAETCLSLVPHEDTITSDIIDCLKNGVPNGNKIGTPDLEEGQPIEYMQAYIDAQHEEADSVEVGRIAGWSVSPFVVAGAVTFFEL